MSKPDKNFFSIHGDDKGNIYMGDRQLYAAGDYSSPRFINVGDIIPTDGSFADSLKLSGVVDLTVQAGRILGSREDVFDINHCKGIKLFIDEAEPTGRFVGTIKGGSDNIRIRIANQIGHGTECDYDFGNWSDQSMARTKHTALEVVDLEGSGPITVRVLHAWRPTLPADFTQDYKVNTSFKGWFGFAFGIVKKLLAVFKR